MVRLYISADIEGVTGVVSPVQCTPKADAEAYAQAVEQMALEVTTIAEAALDAGADHVLVNDAHMAMTNLTIEDLPERVALLSGKPKKVAMAAGLDSSYDAAMLVGYHAKAGTENGILCHTFHSKLFDVSVNGVSYGEGGINALYASLVHQVPVILATGDAALCQELILMIPNLETVETKKALGFAAAENRPSERVIEEMEVVVGRLMEDSAAWKQNLLSLEPPYVLEVTFINTLCADAAALMPGWRRLDGRTLQFQSGDFETLYQALQSAYGMLAYADPLERWL